MRVYTERVVAVALRTTDQYARAYAQDTQAGNLAGKTADTKAGGEGLSIAVRGFKG